MTALYGHRRYRLRHLEDVGDGATDGTGYFVEQETAYRTPYQLDPIVHNRHNKTPKYSISDTQ